MEFIFDISKNPNEWNVSLGDNLEEVSPSNVNTNKPLDIGITPGTWLLDAHPAPHMISIKII